MRRAIRTSVELCCDCFAPRGPVVEIGSRYREGFRELCDLRPCFPGLDYVGCDIQPGPGVDRLEDAEELSFASGSVGTFLLLEVLEHLRRPERAIAEAARVLRDDGLLLVSTPSNYRLHGFPADYWRFTASGLEVLLASFPHRSIFALGPSSKPAFAFAVAGKQGLPEFSAAEAGFRARVQTAFADSRVRGHWSVLKERGRDFFGALLGRADLSVAFLAPQEPDTPRSESGADGRMEGPTAGTGSRDPDREGRG